LIYAHEILNTAADPYGAAEITPNGCASPVSVPTGGTMGCVGRKG